MIKLFVEQAIATVAQSVEQLIRNQQVAGSSPASSSRKHPPFRWVFFFIFIQTENNLHNAIYSPAILHNIYRKSATKTTLFIQSAINCAV